MNEDQQDPILTESQRFVDASRYGDRPQHSALIRIFMAVHKILSDVKLTAAPEGARITQHTPVRLVGPGQIVVRGQVVFGTPMAPHILTGVFLGARTRDSRIFIDDGTFVTNACSIISEGAQITIGKRVLIGAQFYCVDSNFHELAVERRLSPDSRPRPVVIEDDVLIGDGVKILKGVRVGAGSIIGSGAVLLPGFACPPGSTVVGNPAQIVRQQG
jgi:maltose O-acetyltransferase